MAYDPSFSASFLDSHADGDAKGNADLLRLRKVWLDERMSPELLPYETELVQRVREVLRLQVQLGI